MALSQVPANGRLWQSNLSRVGDDGVIERASFGLSRKR